MVRMHERLSAATGGESKLPPTWSILKNLVTPHLLGGCSMGTTQSNGVVDHKGEVFGYRNLFVADGAIVPRNRAEPVAHDCCAGRADRAFDYEIIIEMTETSLAPWNWMRRAGDLTSATHY